MTLTVVCEEVDGDVSPDDFLELRDAVEGIVLDRWPAFVAEPGSIRVDLEVGL